MIRNLEDQLTFMIRNHLRSVYERVKVKLCLNCFNLNLLKNWNKHHTHSTTLRLLVLGVYEELNCKKKESVTPTRH